MELRLNLPISEIYYHPQNPRKVISDIDELAASIKANGILQNLTVVPGHWESEESFLPDGYTVIIGHRRLTAARQAGLYEVPCTIVEMDLQQQIQTMLLENMQRSDLTIYEEAHGFQMLLDFGNSIEEISQKSGFSQTTVRRRIKMMELDQEKLKEVSVRQIPITDFDELAKIENIDERNKLLDKIGTSNFEWAMKSALQDQKRKKNKEKIDKFFRLKNIKELVPPELYNSKYRVVTKFPDDTDVNTITIPPEAEYYSYSKYIGIYLYKVVNVMKNEESAKEHEKANKIREAWDYIEKQSKIFCELRKEFVEKLTLTSKNESTILKGTLLAAALASRSFDGIGGVDMDEVLGIDDTDNEYSDFWQDNLRVLEAVKNIDKNKIPKWVYAMFDDDYGPVIESNFYQMPAYKPSCRIIFVYDWLKSLGYEMSDAEKALVYGTDPIYSEKLDFEGE